MSKSKLYYENQALTLRVAELEAKLNIASVAPESENMMLKPVTSKLIERDALARAKNIVFGPGNNNYGRDKPIENVTPESKEVKEPDFDATCNGCGLGLSENEIAFTNNEGYEYCSDCYEAIQSDPESAAGLIDEPAIDEAVNLDWLNDSLLYKLAVDRYGDDPNSWGQQRDGFKVGYKQGYTIALSVGKISLLTDTNLHQSVIRGEKEVDTIEQVAEITPINLGVKNGIDPCPLCGGKEGETVLLGYREPRYLITCTNCNLTIIDYRKDKVQGKWNTRNGIDFWDKQSWLREVKSTHVPIEEVEKIINDHRFERLLPSKLQEIINELRSLIKPQ